MARTSSILARRTRAIGDDPMPRNIAPMLATAGELPADVQAYNFEWKWDGMRALAYCQGEALRLFSRNRLDATTTFPELQFLSSALEGRSALLDGEIVALDDVGLPSFAKLQRRMHVADPRTAARLARAAPVLYVLFDVLYLDGRSLMNEPYSQRRRVLEELTLAGPHWQITSAHVGEGPAMLAAARQGGLEGVIAKRLDSIYVPGQRSTAWIKIKILRRQEFVVGGWIAEESGRAGRIGAMLLGYHDSDGKLRYAGRVGTGLVGPDHLMLIGLFEKHERPSSPFADKVPGRGIQFLNPKVVVEIEFRRWPDGGLVQQGAFKGVRFDKNPRQVVKELMAGEECKR
ncbi:MAG: polymerase LigD, ligase domain protein [Phycisphaerales bacterium]|nr:polymerase LigD, ligase domain protein [Phycisphaerales bacterium]